MTYFYAEKIPCGEPEVPVEGSVDRIGEDRAEYSCSRGHTLEGDTSLSCSSRGKWQGQAPRCKGLNFCFFKLDFLEI